MASVPLSRLQPSRQEEIDDWPWLDRSGVKLKCLHVISAFWQLCRHSQSPEAGAV